MYVALLDACVLVPSPLCDSLLRLAERGLYRPLWSRKILEEVAKALQSLRPDIAESRIHYRLEHMNATFEDALVGGWEELSAGVNLPNQSDRHVLAAAIHGRAQTIVTFNLRDFPDHYLRPAGVSVTHPDEFLLEQLNRDRLITLQVIADQAAELKRPPSNVDGVLSNLERCGVPRFAMAVRQMKS